MVLPPNMVTLLITPVHVNWLVIDQQDCLVWLVVLRPTVSPLLDDAARWLLRLLCRDYPVPTQETSSNYPIVSSKTCQTTIQRKFKYEA